MASAFHHGISVTETKPSSRAIATIATAVIGLVVTGPAADAAVFPLDRPVLISEAPGALNPIDAVAKAGATGTLKAVLEILIAKVRTPIVIVRVAPGADAAASEAAIIRNDVAGIRTGMQALLAADAQLGVKPRILGAPGLESEDVTAGLATLGAKLRAMAYARGLGEDVATVRAYRAGFTQRELMLLYPDFNVRSAAGVVAPSFVAAHALAQRALIDQQQGWNKTLSNVPVTGVVGTSKDVGFDLQDPNCDANLLNADEVTTIVRLGGELRFWGSRTCATDADFAFESATRTAHIVADTMAEGLVWAVDKPLLPSLVRDIVERINEAFRAMKRAGLILGGEAWFNSAANPTDQLKAGKLRLAYRYTPTPPLEQLGLEQQITDEYFVDFASMVAGA